jgi:hypothetical protein
LNSLDALRTIRALVSAASSFDFRIARSTPSQQCLAHAILDVRHHLLLQIWAKRPSSRVRSSASRAAERTLAVCPGVWVRLASCPCPTPFGTYVETVQTGNLLFSSGMLPVVDHMPKYLGRVIFEVAEWQIFSATFRCLSTSK